jgi:hypothetical protein
MSTEGNETLEELKRQYYKALTWYHSQIPTGFYNQVGMIKDQLEVLNKNMKDAGEASGKLASALNRLTLAGVIVAGFGLLVAAGHLVVEVLKYNKGAP